MKTWSLSISGKKNKNLRAGEYAILALKYRNRLALREGACRELPVILMVWVCCKIGIRKKIISSQFAPLNIVSWKSLEKKGPTGPSPNPGRLFRPEYPQGPYPVSFRSNRCYM